jgi:hypothetical protein
MRRHNEMVKIIFLVCRFDLCSVTPTLHKQRDPITSQMPACHRQKIDKRRNRTRRYDVCL